MLINNAGYLVKKNFLDITKQDLNDTYQVNVFAVFELIQVLYNNLLESKSPSIINIGSVGGINNTLKFPQMSAYSSSKGAVAILTECLAQDLSKDNIIVNSLALGAVNTPMLNQAFPNTDQGISPNKVADYIYKFSVSTRI